MIHLFSATELDKNIEESKAVLERITDGLLNAELIVTFIVAMAIALILGRLLAAVMRRFARMLSTRADKAQDLKEVNRLRRFETLTILTVALVRMILVVVALYFWWTLTHPGGSGTALILPGALTAVVAGATIAPILRDLSYGGVMMAEHWFGVGDHIKVEPFSELQGVVERVTLRSTKIRGLNGEIIWISNQNIQGVRVSPKGVRTIAIDLFVPDLDMGLGLVEATNMRLPSGPLMVVRPLQIMSKTEVGEDLWHIVAIGETAPGREWLLEKYALNIMTELDEDNKKKILSIDPIARYADGDAERRFARTVQNARKSPLENKRLRSPEEIAKQLLGRHKARRTKGDKSQPKTPLSDGSK